MVTRDSTRQRLLDAADELLFTDGVQLTPVDRVLERAGVSPATLYRAYGSKEALVTAALERRHEQWLAVWDQAIGEAAGDRGRLLAVFAALERFRARADGARWCAFLGTAAEVTDPAPELAAALRRESDALRDRLRELARPVAAAQSSALAEALMLVVSGELAMRLRPGKQADGLSREVAQVLIDHWAKR